MRVAGSYKSVILGVSQQEPEDRREGQATEQINMISDPVRGLARRWGSLQQDVQPIPEAFKFTPAALDDIKDWKTFDFRMNGQEYAMSYRIKAVPPGSNFPFAFVFSKSSGKFIPMTLASADAQVQLVQDYGVSAITSVGRFVYFASNSNVNTPALDEAWSGGLNPRFGIVWVRSALFGREYTATIKLSSGKTVQGTYFTPSQQYPGTLDISDIPITLPNGDLNPRYNAQVQQRQTDYNNRVNQWLLDAANAVQPQNVAQKLRDALAKSASDQGIPCVISRDGSHVGLRFNGDEVIDDISVSDGGDGTALRGVANTVPAIEDLSPRHFAGKVVRVRPTSGGLDDVYYVKAFPKIGDTADFTDITEVVWQETAGQVVTPKGMFLFLTVKNEQAYVASDMEVLAGMLGEDPDTLPHYVTSLCGDLRTHPLPQVFGKRITYLGMFQDRLVVGAGSTLLLSKTSDYLSFFTSSSLTVKDDDPFEVQAQGAEDDVIRASVMYDRSLLLFGDAFQYRLSGQQVMTPKNRGMPVVGAHEDALNANPVASGNFVFFGRYRNGFSTLHQIQAGTISDTQAAYEITQQLDSYVEGIPVGLLATTAPNMLFVRTDTHRHGLYVYTYLDSQDGGQRLFDAWSRWEWSESLGYIMGLTQKDSDVTVFTLRVNGTQASIVADRFILSGELSPRPYLDSLVPYTGQPVVGDYAAAYGKGSRAFVQADPSDTAGAWYGANYAASGTPTNPFIRTGSGNVVGRFTLTKFLIEYRNTGGAEVVLSLPRRPDAVISRYRGALLGYEQDIVGAQPIGSDTVSALVGKEVRDFSYTIRSVRWLPLTVSGIKWQGQWFNNAPHV